MPKLVASVTFAFARLRGLRATILTMVIAAVPGLAHAQCVLTGGTGPLPWSNCTTWTGPAWPTWFSTLKPALFLGVQPMIETGDINGDGITDLLYLSPGGSAAAISTGSTFSVVPVPSNWSAVNAGECYTGNFDGSGRAGIVCSSTSGLVYAAANGNGYGNFAPITVNSSGTGIIWGINQVSPTVAVPNPCFVMDVDGDGTDDIVCGAPIEWPTGGSMNPTPPGPGQTWGVYLWTNGSFTYQVWNGPSWGYTQSQYCKVGDFNGDGLKDLACIFNNDGTSTTWTMLISTGKGWSVQSWVNGPAHATPPTTGPVSPTQYYYVGDFDGDGIDDILTATSSTTAQVSFGGGKNGFKSIASWPYSLGSGGFCSVTDIFGVGRAGLICATTFGATSTGWTYLSSTGTGLTQTNFTTPWTLEVMNSVNQLILPTNISQMCVFADFNGDGIKDIACNPGLSSGLIGGLQGSPTWLMGLSSRPQ